MTAAGIAVLIVACSRVTTYGSLADLLHAYSSLRSAFDHQFGRGVEGVLRCGNRNLGRPVVGVSSTAKGSEGSVLSPRSVFQATCFTYYRRTELSVRYA